MSLDISIQLKSTSPLVDTLYYALLPITTNIEDIEEGQDGEV